MMEDHLNEIIASIVDYVSEYLTSLVASANQVIFL